MAGGRIDKIAKRCCACALLVTLISGIGTSSQAAPPGKPNQARGKSLGFGSTYAQRKQVIDRLPMERLTNQAQQRILSIANSPTIYRRLPTQAIHSDRDMFLFLTRNPEVLVGIWDLMGITKVTTKRTGPYQLEAEDGSGTQCQVDLVYGDPNLHIFVADGSYDGKLVAKPIRGQAVFILHSKYAPSASGGTTVTGTLDCFIQFDSLGADLIARTLSGLIGRSADNNFKETARFIAQVSQASEKNPAGLIDVAQRLPQVTESTKRAFVNVIATVARRSERKLVASRPQDHAAE